MSVFIAVSVVDTFALVKQFETLVMYAGKTSATQSDSGCKIMNWISTLSQMCSSYFVLLFTIERFISVRFPLKRSIICTKRRINIAIISIVVGAALTTVYDLYYQTTCKIVLCLHYCINVLCCVTVHWDTVVRQ